MLAFAKDITQNKPKHPEESKNSELKEYMDYQRKLNHERIVYLSLDHAKTYLQQNMDDSGGDREKLEKYLQQAFPLSHALADADTLMLMLRKLVNGHNSTNNWYRMNAYYYALVYDCIKRFIKIYNRLLRESPEKAVEYRVSEGMEIDFDDWANLYFPDLDFHIGKELDSNHYPFAKRNKAIEEDIAKEMQNGKSREEALNSLKEKYEIEDPSIKVLLNQKVNQKDLELFYTSVENPIYELLTLGEEGQWGTVEGETPINHAYYMGSHLKVWEWRKREEAESLMEDLSQTRKK
ncbi:MAG: hypothetical protein V3U37_03220 [Nitrospinaceae bacterium]